MLERLGFRRGRVVECIATTADAHGMPNAAPVGAYLLSPRTAVLKLHTRTRTFANLAETRRVVLNITSDPLLFLKTALLDAEAELDFSTTGSGMPYLKDALAYAELRLLDSRRYTLRDSLGESEAALLRLEAEEVEVLAPPQAFSRGACALVELAVELSRRRCSELESRLLRVARRCLSAAEVKEAERMLELCRSR